MKKAGYFYPLAGLFIMLFFSISNAQTDKYSYGYSGIGMDGNRYVNGKGSFPNVRAMDIELSGRPLWVVAAPENNGSIWAVALADGRVEAFSISGSSVRKAWILPEIIPEGAPPVLFVEKGIRGILPSGSYMKNFHTYPVVLPRSGKTAVIDGSGNLIIEEKGKKNRLEINALIDARIVFDGKERLFILTDPDESYRHGILGDRLEATKIKIVETSDEPKVAEEISVEKDRVIESLSPILANINGDGSKEIIVTVSDAMRGAQIVAYNERGKIEAEGKPIGQGYRWIHQIAVAAFGMGEEVELAAVRTPHIGGIVEYYRYMKCSLMVVAKKGGFSTHRIGSRNLDMGIAGDFDGNGDVELLLPNQSFDMLFLLSRSEDGIEVESSYPFDGKIQTNIAAVWSEEDALIAGAGREDGILRVWVPY